MDGIGQVLTARRYEGEGEGGVLGGTGQGNGGPEEEAFLFPFARCHGRC